MAANKKTFGIIGIAVAGAAIYFLSRATSLGDAVKKLQFRNPKIKLGNISLFNTKATITVDVHNPTNTNVPVDYLSGNLSYQNKNLTAFRVDGKATNLVVKKQSVTPIIFEVALSNFNVVGALLNILGSGVKTVVNVQGIFYAMGQDINFSFAYDVVNQQVIAISGTDGRVTVNGIAGVEAKLQFSSNADMEKYFAGKRSQKKMFFSKN